MAVAISFICSLSEAGLLSIRRTDVIKLKETGVWGAGILEELKADVDRSLAGILTVNTLANCFGAAGVGSAAAKIWGNSGMATASAILTMTILVFSEIIPKTLGATHSFKLANVIAEVDAGVENISVEERSAEVTSVIARLSVRDRTHLAKAIRRLRNLPGVIGIIRLGS